MRRRHADQHPPELGPAPLPPGPFRPKYPELRNLQPAADMLPLGDAPQHDGDAPDGDGTFTTKMAASAAHAVALARIFNVLDLRQRLYAFGSGELEVLEKGCCSPC